MENWGLVTFREIALLIDSEQTSTLTKMHVWLVIAHELAHFWFGNLATMVWDSILFILLKTRVGIFLELVVPIVAQRRLRLNYGIYLRWKKLSRIQSVASFPEGWVCSRNGIGFFKKFSSYSSNIQVFDALIIRICRSKSTIQTNWRKFTTRSLMQSQIRLIVC